MTIAMGRRRYDDLPTEMWANGEGTTRPVLVERGQPQCCADLHWRVSLAEIDRPVRFSRSGRTERWMTVVAGDGLAVDIAGDDVTLQPGAVVAYSGGATVSAAPVGTRVVVLNLMTGPSFTGELRVRPVDGEYETSPGAVAGVTVGGPVRVAGELVPPLTSLLPPWEQVIIGAAPTTIVDVVVTARRPTGHPCTRRIFR